MINFVKKNKDLALIAGVVLILITLFSPIPPGLLDLAIIVNFGFALTILFLTFYVSTPVQFSTFPSLLLIATLFRLSLNIAATRLILTEADAGAVIGSIGAFAMGGVFIVGLVVFFILIVVQFVVVTSGAQRVSEVAARFMLDSLPGQQMSIDADLNMGVITQEEARAKRDELEREASFYGSMDGASKFVKGDAIAGLVIVLIDIIAGLIIGVVQMGMGWGESLEHFALLTVGDGIATQLPALIIAVATGIIVTRSASDRDLSSEVVRQLTAMPRVPVLVSIILAALLLLPGMPKWPIALLVPFAIFAFIQMRQGRPSDDETELQSGDETETLDPDVPAPIKILLAPDLDDAWSGQKSVLLDRVDELRGTQTDLFGIGFPKVVFERGKRLASHAYQIHLFGTRYAQGKIQCDCKLAIETEQVSTPLSGTTVQEPTFGLNAVWVSPPREDEARDAGYSLIEPMVVFITHLGNVLQSEAATLLNRERVSALIEGVRRRQPGLVEELVPTHLTTSDIQTLLRNLIEERVKIANIDLIFEHLADLARQEKSIPALTELIRQRLGVVICNDLRGQHDDLAVLSLDPRLESDLQTAIAQNRSENSAMIDPRLVDPLLRRLAVMSDDMFKQGRQPVLLCSAGVRRTLRSLTARLLPRLALLSVAEVSNTIELSSFGVVKLDTDTSRSATQTGAASSGAGFQTSTV